ncbi:MAG TPA: hypothetical protein VEP89_01265 [Draconibacterium sp.]|nr:hypothetical protein [Draconibacterium sp.]
MCTTSAVLIKVHISKFIKVTLCNVMVASLIGCQPLTLSQDATVPSDSTPQVKDTILPPKTIEPLPRCIQVPGIKIGVVILSSGSVKVEVTGLVPDEEVTYIFYSEAANQTFKIESSPLEGADSNGSIEFIEEELNKISGGLFKEWHVQVIHSKGVACVDFDLPQ